MNATRRYRAFISYSHRDARVAAWLHRALEGYRVPKRLRGSAGEFGPLPERLSPIFRDREELASSGDLGARVQQALSDSDALIVVCSPDSAKSRWVNEEVLAFKRRAPSDRIYCLIAAGEPHAGDAHECFPQALRFEIEADGELGQRPAEPIAADIRPGKDGKSLALLKLIAGLLGTDLDKLRQREAQRRHRRMLAIAIASLIGMAIAIALAATAWIARNEAVLARNDAQRRQAQAEDLLGFMLGDLKDKLDKVGRLDLLDSVYAKATDYFASLEPRDLTDKALSHQAELLTKIGQVRLSQARYAEALASFRSAYTRSSALAARDPRNGGKLFDRGQAEYWVGYVYFQSRDLERTHEWFTRYRDTCRAVHAIDPKNNDWLHELSYGDADLATLDLERGDLAQAEEGFKRSRATLQMLLVRISGDDRLTVLFEIADDTSWLGNIAEQSGHLDEAEALLADKADVLRRISASQPAVPNWKEQLSTSELMQSDVMRVRGRYAQAESLADDAAERMKTLVAHDPTNKDWSQDYARALVLRATARIGTGKPDAATADLAIAQPLLDAEAKVANANRRARRDLLDALSLRTQLLLHAGNAAGARAEAQMLLALHAKDLHRDTADDIGRYALAEWLAALVDADGGAPSASDPHLVAAHSVLAPLATNSRYWRVLDPWLRVAIARGDTAETTRVRKLLDAAGYVPLFPWPVANATVRPSVVPPR